MKRSTSIILSFLFPLLVLAQSKTTVIPLGHYDKVHLGMTVGEVEKAYNCEVVKRGPVGGIISHSDKFNIETSHVTINLAEIGREYKLKELVFPEMHLEFINKILVEIKFTANEEYLKDEEKATEIVNHLKWKYSGEYKGYKEYSPPSNVSNSFSRSINLSSQKFITQRLGSEAKWNVHFKEVPSTKANLLRFSYAIKAPRKIKKPYYGGKITLKMRYNAEIYYWKLFVELMNKSQAAGLKPTNTFRNKNLGTSLVAFKETYANTIVPHDPRKNALFGNLTPKFAPYVTVYTLSDEKLTLLNHGLAGVYYIFYEDKLQGIKIVFDSILQQQEYNKLRENIKTVFGKPSIDWGPETDGKRAETLFWSDSYIKQNFGEDYFTSLEEKFVEISQDQLADLALRYTNFRDDPTSIFFRLSRLYSKLDVKAKEDNKETLQSDF